MGRDYRLARVGARHGASRPGLLHGRLQWSVVDQGLVLRRKGHDCRIF
jgi:hypothetical protein